MIDSVVLALEFPSPVVYVVNGLSLGGIFALIAIGYTMVYGIIKLVNFAHGEVFMISGFILLTLLNDPSGPANRLQNIAPWVHPALATVFALCTVVTVSTFLRNRIHWIGLAALALGCGGAVGFLFHAGARRHVDFFLAFPFACYLMATLAVTLDTLAYKPLRTAPRLVPLISAIGASIILLNLALVCWGSEARNFAGVGVPAVIDTNVKWFGFLPQEDAIIILVSLATMGVVHLLVNRTKLGMAMRAVSLDQPTARLMGIDVDKVIAATFALGAVIAVIGVFLYERRLEELRCAISARVGIIAFASAVLGGIGSVPGAMLGGLLIGIATQAVYYADKFAEKNYQLQLDLGKWETGVAYAVLVVFLILRPQGILGRKTVDRA